MDKLLQSDAERAEEKESEGQQSMMMGEEQQRLSVCSGGTDSVLIHGCGNWRIDLDEHNVAETINE